MSKGEFDTESPTAGEKEDKPETLLRFILGGLVNLLIGNAAAGKEQIEREERVAAREYAERRRQGRLRDPEERG